MTGCNRLKFLMTLLIASSVLAMSAQARAEAALDYLTSSYAGPTVEDNVVLMDTDKNGFADVYEVRAFLELKHGKGYEHELLDKWQSAASGKSCGSAFAKGLYSEK
jgi:hypothetical protein